jgi:hypothetical protein
MVTEQQQAFYTRFEQGWWKAKLHWNKHFSQTRVKMSATMATVPNPGVLFNRCVTPDRLSRIFKDIQGSNPLEPSRLHVEKMDKRMSTRAITRDHLLGNREEWDEFSGSLAIDRRLLSQETGYEPAH